MAAQEAEVLNNQEFIDILDYEFSGDNATVLRKRALIEAYREEGSIYHAALTSRVNRKTVYRWMESDPQFALALEESKEDCYDQVETSVFKKAVNGSTLDAIFYLKAHRPKFRDRLTIDVEGVRDEILERMSQLGVDSLPQLPAMTTEFLNTQQLNPLTETTDHMHVWSNGRCVRCSEIDPVGNQVEFQQIPPEPALQQKDLHNPPLDD